jgi:hypothetical protein
VIRVFDVVTDPPAYRAAVSEHPPAIHQSGSLLAAANMMPATNPSSMIRTPNRSLHDFILSTFAHAWPTLSFFCSRSDSPEVSGEISSEGKREGWTAILFLNPKPVRGAGITFWRHIASGAPRGLWDPELARDPAAWSQWFHVEEKFNRLVIFPADVYRSRATGEHSGDKDDPGLIQVLAGGGDMQELDERGGVPTLTMAIPEQATN